MASVITFFRNVALSGAATSGQTSTVGEPSVAANGDSVFFTGNWYASRSADNAATWQVVDPFTALPPADGGFCCDQTAIFAPAQSLTIWLPQYIEKNATNTLRIAVHKDPGLDPSGWVFRDLRPVDVDASWNGQWFDYNHAAVSDGFLYAQHSVSDPRVHVAGGGDAGDGLGRGCVSWSAGNYSAPGPDGQNWLSRCDPRITGVWVSRGEIGIMWSANRRPPDRPMPYVRVVRVDEATALVVDELDIWNAQYAYAYADACPNIDGDVGITIFRGGGPRFPSHVVGFLDQSVAAWRLRVARSGTDGPADGKWGDYLTCRRHSPQPDSWVAAGYTLQGGGARTNIQPRYVHFGRHADSSTAP